MNRKYEFVAKTLQGLEDVLAEELRALGATQVEPGLRAVTFYGDLEMLYKANFCCRTALRILKPIYKFYASSTDELYERTREFNWIDVLGLDKTFAVDTVAHSEEFNHSLFATYRVKDAISDWFSDRNQGRRPKVSVSDPDILINVHIAGDRVTISLDSSGEPLYKRGWRAAQNEAPLNEVLAAGIILKSGWRGETPFVDPMCGSGTFLIEAALIAANIYPGIFRQHFAFEKWKDFDADLFERIFNDDSAEREITVPIIGADISPKAIAITEKNIRNAHLKNRIQVSVKSIADWEEAPAGGVMITNPPYGERLNPVHLMDIYSTLGRKLKHVFTGYHAWVLGYRPEHFDKISLTPSQKIKLLNGKLECELREYIMFEGKKREFRKEGGELKTSRPDNGTKAATPKRSFKPTRPGGRHQTDKRPNANFESTPGYRFKKAFENDEKAKPRNNRRPKSEYPFTKKKNNKKDI